MHENKFEKQVSEKMDQLGFDPSDEVWARVDREINNEKRKRRPLFWIFFFSGLILGAASVYTVMKLNSPADKKTIGSEGLSGDHHKSVLTRSSEGENDEGKEIPKNQDPATLVSSDSSNQYTDPGAVKSQKNNRMSVSRIAYMHNGRSNTSEKNREVEKNKQVNTVEKPESGFQNTSAEDKKTENDKTTGNAIIVVNPITVTTVSKEKTANKPLKTDSAAAIQTARVAKPGAKTSPWSLVFSATAGFSNIHQNLFQSVNLNSSYYLYTPASSGTGSAQIPGTYAPSNVQAGFSFGAGITVNRKISKRVSLSAGLNYHYYSTKIHTGKTVDSSRSAYASNGQAASVSSYYQGGQTQEYTNQYHYAGIPVSMSFQLNKSLSHPINWEAGFSLSLLLGSNALQFDPGDNIYFKNNQLINKTQWNATTAVMVGFPVHEYAIQLGPQLEYGLSGLLNSNSGNPGHLFYLGLKCSFIFKK